MAKMTWASFLKKNMSDALKKYKNDRSKAMKYLAKGWAAYKKGGKANPVKSPAKKKAVKRTTKKTASKRASKKYASSTVYIKPRSAGGFSIHRSNGGGTSLSKLGYVLSIPDAKRWLRTQGETKAVLVK